LRARDCPAAQSMNKNNPVVKSEKTDKPAGHSRPMIGVQGTFWEQMSFFSDKSGKKDRIQYDF
jgi:hypothetical protein